MRRGVRKITDKEMQNILDDMTIIVDTREKKNQHILDYLTENKIPYIIKKLDIADYSFELPNYPQLNVDRQFLVEKKNSLDEIVGNFTKDRERFAREFERITNEKIHLVIETATWRKLLNGSYRSKFPPKSFMASLMTYAIRYNIKVWFAEVKESPTIIYNLLRYELFEHLKELRKKEEEK